MSEAESLDGNGADGGAGLSVNDTSPAAIGPLVAISNEMVRIYKEQFGRGPTKVRTNYAGPNTLVCLLEDTLTPAGRNLKAMGEHQRLRDLRLLFQSADAARFTEPIERITGRRIVGFISGIDTNADIACELFVLEAEDRSTDR